MDSPKLSQLLKMLDGRMPEDACTASSPNEYKGTGKQKSFFQVALKMLTILNLLPTLFVLITSFRFVSM